MSVIEELKERIDKRRDELRQNSNCNNSNHTLTRLDELHEVKKIIEELETREKDNVK